MRKESCDLVGIMRLPTVVEPLELRLDSPLLAGAHCMAALEGKTGPIETRVYSTGGKYKCTL